MTSPQDRNPLRFRPVRDISPGALKLVAAFKAAGKPKAWEFVERETEKKEPKA